MLDLFFCWCLQSMWKGEALTTACPSFQLPPCQQTRSVPTAVMGPSAPFYSILPPHLFAGLYNFVSPVSVVACHLSDICFLYHCVFDGSPVLMSCKVHCWICLNTRMLDCYNHMSSLHSALAVIETNAAINFWLWHFHITHNIFNVTLH